MAHIIMALTVATLGLQVAHLYYYGEGRMRTAYRLGILVFAGFMVLETVLALRTPDQHAILLFRITNGWGLWSCIKGLRRLGRE
jgi:hypothetical protein